VLYLRTMKLRIRFQSRRELIEVPTPQCTISELMQTLSTRLSLTGTAFSLSLDGKTPLPTEEHSTLTDLGIVGGDLLHVIVDSSNATRTSHDSISHSSASYASGYHSGTSYASGYHSGTSYASGYHSGMSSSSSCKEVHQCRLSAADFVHGNVDLKSNGAADVYKNLQRLSLAVKDQLAYPLLSSMRHELNLEEIYGFMALPTEVKLMVLCLLPVKDILNMSATCREIQAISSDHILWQHLCFRDFGLLTKGRYSTWKMEYKRHYKDIVERERNRQQFIIPGEGMYDPPGLFTPYSPFNPPGMIGGRHDMFPNVPFMPGGVHPNPGSLPTPGNLPRPRFDPYGPIPDMDINPGHNRRTPGRGRGRGGFPPGPFF
ncbi:hypothetical protein QZH41_019427, partial [Actinostola sp. cb2023]